MPALQNLPGRTIVPRELALRVDRVAMRIGRKETAAKLGIGRETLESVLHEERLLDATIAKIAAALPALEAES